MGQIAAIIKRKTAEAQARLRAMSEAGKPLEALSRKYSKIENLSTAVRAMHRRVGQQLTPTIRQMVAANYSAGSGENDSRNGYHHGDLQRAVNAANVVVGLNGIYIRLGQGMDEKVYIVASSLQYGAIRGSRKEGRARAAEKRKGLQRAAGNQQRTVGNKTVIAAHPFFKITDSQVSQLEAQYTQLLQDEINRALAG